MYRRNVDETLRDIERRAAQGDPNAQVDLLKWRLRAGITTASRLNLAAALGNEAAKTVIAGMPETSPITFPLPSIGLETSERGSSVMFQPMHQYLLGLSQLDPRQPVIGNLLSLAELLELMARLIVLIKAWIHQQEAQDQRIPDYMIDHIAGLEMDLDYSARMIFDPNYLEIKSWHFTPTRPGFHRREYRKSTPNEIQQELLRKVVEWWIHYEVSNVRRLAYAYFDISQTPELTDEIFNPWHLEFVQPLLPWALGSDTSTVFRMPPFKRQRSGRRPPD